MAHIFVLLTLAVFIVVVSTVIGYLAGKSSLESNSDKERVDFLNDMDYSLQCVNGVWGVTEGSIGIVGKTSDDLREAIDSAIGVQPIIE